MTWRRNAHLNEGDERRRRARALDSRQMQALPVVLDGEVDVTVQGSG
jgi:hypothetical protein